MGLSTLATSPEELIHWQRWRFAAAALLPAIWLVFSLSLPHLNYKAVLAKWKWIILLTFLIPVTFVSLFASHFFQGLPQFTTPMGWLLLLGWSGRAFQISFLLGFVITLMLLERTLRSSSGLKRWKIKPLILGVGCIIASGVYTASQELLFGLVNLKLEAINAAALLMGGLLILSSLFRANTLQFDIYFSNRVLTNSIVFIFAGVLFLAVGILSVLLQPVDNMIKFQLHVFLIFTALLAGSAVILSHRLRHDLKLIISRHFRRPYYDYREVWTSFVRNTISHAEVRGFCDSVCKLVSEILGIPSVSIWLLDEDQKRLKLTGSSSLPSSEITDISGVRESDLASAGRTGDVQVLYNVSTAESVLPEGLRKSNTNFFQHIQAQHCVLLVALDRPVGLMAFGDRIGGASFSLEDEELLKILAKQTAGGLLNLRLLERMRQAKEMEAFQTVGAFFVHDLKNLTSTLSLLLQNLPAHFDNPAFREDAVRLLSQGIDRINALCGSISSLQDRLEIQPVETDFNGIVANVLAQLDGVLGGSVVKNLNPLPKMRLDPEQMQKVLTNLLLNAHDAAGESGKIKVTTERRDGWVELTVSDNGCGISPEFIKECLFKPFKTTKKQGIGIGLFQSKIIVERHNGRIEVESQEGAGSTFRLLLPVKDSAAARH